MLDLTGTNPEFLVEDVRFQVFRPTQRIYFNGPVYANSIVIRQINGDGSTTPIDFSVTGWQYYTEDHDNAAISEAKVADETFNFLLIKSAVIVRNFTSEYQIAVDYQKLKSNLYDDAHYIEDGPECSPGLLKAMIDTIEYLKNVSNPVKNITTTLLSGVRMLDEDLTGVNEDNHIVGEVHYADVQNNKQIIRPGCGSYYEHDLKITVEANNEVLVLNTDYILISTNLAKTKIAEHPSGVFDHIYLIRPIQGNILVDYRAFGGEITFEDFNIIKNALAAVVNFLQYGRIVTEDTLGGVDTFVELANRVEYVEDWIRAFDNTVPAVNFRINPGDDEQKHWYNIAKMWKRTDTGEYIHTKDNFHFRLRFKTSGVMMDCIMSVDVENPAETFDFEVLTSNNVGEGVQPWEYASLLRGVLPEFRIVYRDENDGNGVTTGIWLQMGVALRGITFDDCRVENHSGQVCQWVLNDDAQYEWAAKDDNIILPDGTTVWIEASAATCFSSYHIAGPDDGYLAWAGSIPVNDIEVTKILLAETEEGHYLNHICENEDVKINQVKMVEVVFYDRLLAEFNRCRRVVHSDDDKIVWFKMFCPEDSGLVGMRIIQAVDKSMTMEIGCKIGDHTKDNNRFDLRQVLLYFNKDE